MPKLQMLSYLAFKFFLYSLVINPSATMAKWLVVPSLTYTMDYNIYTDYKESYGNDTIYSINILTSVLHRYVCV